MSITNNGNVGIGDTSPDDKLDVEGSDAGPLVSFTNTYSTVGANNPDGLLIDFSVSTPDNNSDYFIYAEDATAPRFIVYSDGDVVNDDNSYGAISDERLKENILDAPSQLDSLKSVQIRSFNRLGSDETEIGVIAQEIQKVYPDLVRPIVRWKSVEVPSVTMRDSFTVACRDTTWLESEEVISFRDSTAYDSTLVDSVWQITPRTMALSDTLLQEIQRDSTICDTTFVGAFPDTTWRTEQAVLDTVLAVEYSKLTPRLWKAVQEQQAQIEVLQTGYTDLLRRVEILEKSR